MEEIDLREKNEQENGVNLVNQELTPLKIISYLNPLKLRSAHR